MQLLALEEEEEQREKSVAGTTVSVPSTGHVSAPHGTKRPKPALKGDSLDVPTLFLSTG